MRTVATDRNPDREQLRPMLGVVVDELTDAACQRVLLGVRGAAKRDSTDCTLMTGSSSSAAQL
jgi:hypothetical protein